MITTADNFDRQIVEVFRFQATKINKHSTIYSLENLPERSSFITPTVKIEKNQWFAKTQTSTWFRLKDQSNWAKSELVTGLYKTTVQGVYYGDRRDSLKTGVRTLLMFKFNQTADQLETLVFSYGYYPSPIVIESIAQTLK